MSRPTPDQDSEYIRRAREMWCDDDLEIDPSPATSVSDEGCWVQAWVWVPAPDDLDALPSTRPGATVEDDS